MSASNRKERNRRSICWLGQDLRLGDNAPLAAATAGSDEVAVAYVVPERSRSGDFALACAVEVDKGLRALGSRLMFVRSADEMQFLARQLGAEAAYGPAGPGAVRVKDRVLLDVQDLPRLPKTYSAYRRAWLDALRPEHYAAHEFDAGKLMRSAEMPECMAPGAVEPLDAPGEGEAAARLGNMGNKFLNYERDRDYPAIDGTSRLSAHLNAGTLSIRSAVRTALQAGPDGQKWLDELIWREFYFAWFEAEPSMVDLEMNPSMREIEWSHDRDRLERWREGSTGFPIVDAAMRCLHQTGWLHNRLRMVAASFLIKDLLVDWREGRDWFARQLVDHDAAQNAGGWQWCASTGFDAQPWFRIFNPENQSRKFDPDSAFTKRWCPELADCEPERIHLMHCGGDRPAKYPPNVVDHRQQRELALRTLRPRRQAGALN